MTRIRIASVAFGTLFGFLLAWSTFAQPDAIREMLLFEDWYLYPTFASAVAVGFVGVRLLRWHGLRSLLTGERVTWATLQPQRRHVVGSVIFGTGWGLSDACPGPVAAQIGGGLLWSLCTAAGIVFGILLFFARSDRVAQASERKSSGVLTFASSASSTATTAASSSSSAS
jgi:uncharacterized membrane protein YedE/YeeE